jgi:hypothetical protein
VPRILFLDPQGKVDTSIRNKKGSPKYAHIYFDAKGIIASMQEALRKYAPDAVFSDEL